jgi:hypothetical protein
MQYSLNIDSMLDWKGMMASRNAPEPANPTLSSCSWHIRESREGYSKELMPCGGSAVLLIVRHGGACRVEEGFEICNGNKAKGGVLPLGRMPVGDIHSSSVNLFLLSGIGNPITREGYG